MEINVMESTLLRPAQPTPQTRLWISALDLLAPTIHISTLYFYHSHASPNFFQPDALKDGLSKALVPFYPVAGRLAKDQHGRLEINCNAEGALFVHATSNFTLHELGDLSTSCSHLTQLVPSVDRSDDISSYPLLVLQVTRFKCGGVCVGVGFHHTVADGTGAVHFVNTWSDMVRGVPHNNLSPSIDRTLLRARVPPTPTFHHKEYIPSQSLVKPNNIEDNDSLKDNLVVGGSNKVMPTVIKITLDQLNALKAKSSFSTYEILTAHIWRCLCKARNLPNDQATTLYLPTDGRSRLNPPLPASYLGNVLFTNTVTLPAGDIQSEALSCTASKIHEAIMKMKDEYLRSAIDYLEVEPHLTAFQRNANTFASPNVKVISWMRLPMYDADFGWGRPIQMGPTTVTFDGNVYIIPCPERGGGLSLLLTLKPHERELFHKYLNDEF